MAGDLAWAAALVLGVVLLAGFGARRATAQLPGFWGDPRSRLRRFVPLPGGRFRLDAGAGAPAAPRCSLRGFRRLVCEGDGGTTVGRVGLGGRRLYWGGGEVWYRQGP
jgi:hypothetical protein